MKACLHFLCRLYRCTSVLDQRKAAQSSVRQTEWPGSNTGRPDHNLPENQTNTTHNKQVCSKEHVLPQRCH